MPHGLSPFRFEAVLFDVDGTLVDSIEMIVLGLGDTFEHYFHFRPDDEQIRSLIGLPLDKQYGKYMDTPPTESQVAEMSQYTLGRYEFHRHAEKRFDPAVEALQLCHESGVKTALVTSKNKDELAAFLPNFTGALFIHESVCASDVSHPKPDPESALLACKRLGIEPSRAIMVGDSVFDLRCARGAGLSCIAVAYGAGSREALLAERPDELFDTPEELLAWAKSAFLQTSCAERR
jgi:HAD superfamily hydrolase (TIGR01509 family)